MDFSFKMENSESAKLTKTECMVGKRKKPVSVAEERTELDVHAYCELIITESAPSSRSTEQNWLVVSW